MIRACVFALLVSGAAASQVLVTSTGEVEKSDEKVQITSTIRMATKRTTMTMSTDKMAKVLVLSTLSLAIAAEAKPLSVRELVGELVGDALDIAEEVLPGVGVARSVGRVGVNIAKDAVLYGGEDVREIATGSIRDDPDWTLFPTSEEAMRANFAGFGESHNMVQESLTDAQMEIWAAVDNVKTALDNAKLAVKHDETNALQGPSGIYSIFGKNAAEVADVVKGFAEESDLQLDKDLMSNRVGLSGLDGVF